jgi:hypothetical protein
MLFPRLLLLFYLHQNPSLFFYFTRVHHLIVVVCLYHSTTGTTITILVGCAQSGDPRNGKRGALLLKRRALLLKRGALLLSLVRSLLLAAIQLVRAPSLLLLLLSHESLHLPRQYFVRLAISGSRAVS